MSRRALALFAAVLCLLSGGRPRAEAPAERRPVASYVLRGKLDPVGHTLDGTLRVVWRNSSASPVSAIRFRLPLNGVGDHIRIGSVTREDGGALECDQAGAGATVRLLAPVAPGETTALLLTFTTRFPPLRGGVGWWGAREEGRYLSALDSIPLVAALRSNEAGEATWSSSSDYADFRVTLRTPKGILAAASGRRTDAPLDNGDGTLSFSWSARSRREFAFVVTDALRVREFGVGSRVLFPPDHAAIAQRLVDAAQVLVPGDTVSIVDLPAGCAGFGEFAVRGLVALSTDRTAPERTREVEWSLLDRLRPEDRQIAESAWGMPRPGRRYGTLATRYFDPRVHWIRDPDGIWLYFASQPALHLDRDVAVRPHDPGLTEASLVRAEQRSLGDGRWEWVLEVRCGAGLPEPIEVWAKDRNGASELIAQCDSDRTWTLTRDAPLAAAWLGPDWLDRVDPDPFDNARRVAGDTDSRAALALAWRALLAFEEQLRAYVGVTR